MIIREIWRKAASDRTKRIVGELLELPKNVKVHHFGDEKAEMHGQRYRENPCRSFGDASVFSFYPNKHITTERAHDRHRR